MQVEGSSPSSNHLAPKALTQNGPQHLGQSNQQTSKYSTHYTTWPLIITSHKKHMTKEKTKPKNLLISVKFGKKFIFPSSRI